MYVSLLRRVVSRSELSHAKSTSAWRLAALSPGEHALKASNPATTNTTLVMAREGNGLSARRHEKRDRHPGEPWASAARVRCTRHARIVCDQRWEGTYGGRVIRRERHADPAQNEDVRRSVRRLAWNLLCAALSGAEEEHRWKNSHSLRFSAEDLSS